MQIIKLRSVTSAALAFLLVAGVLASLRASADTPEEELAAASALYEAQKYADAAGRLDAFLAAYPRHDRAGAAAYALGRCRTELKQYDKAIPAYQKAIAANDNTVLTLARLGLGEAAINLHAYEKAAPALEAALTGALKPQQTAIAWFWLGQADYELKKYDQSDDAYRHVISSFPHADFVDSATFGAGLAELKRDDAVSARRKFQSVISKFPNSEDRPQAQLLLARMDLDDKHYQNARSGFEAVLNGKVNDNAAGATASIRSQAEDGLIQALLALGDYDAAIPRLQSVLERLSAADPERFRAELSLGNCYYRQKQYSPALTAYLDAAKASDPSVAAEGLYWAANVELAQEHPGDAASLFSKMAGRYPKHQLAAHAALKAGDALLAANHGPAAMAAYRLVVDRYPTSAEADTARKALGSVLDSVSDPVQLAAALKAASPSERIRGQIRIARIYLESKKYAEAIADLTEMLKSKPDVNSEAEGQYLLGLSNEGVNHSAAAASAYSDAIRLNGSAEWVVDADGRLAWLYLDLKQPANAEKAAVAALALHPEKSAERQDRLALVQAQVDQQKWDAALEGCQSLLDSGSTNDDSTATVLYTQAWINEQRNHSDEALPIWEKLANDYPKSPNTAEALIHLGDARLKTEKYDEARSYYTRLIADFPKSTLVPQAHFKLGSALFNSDKPADAAGEFILAADDKSAGDYIPEALYWAGVALDKSGKKDEAIQRLTKLVINYPKHARTPNAKIRLAALKAVSGS